MIRALKVPDRDGNLSDVVLGFDDLDGYKSKDNPYLGALIGRFANRIANGQFKLSHDKDTTYQLDKNNGPNALHGGNVGFDKY